MSYHGEWPVGSTAIFWLFSSTLNGVPTTLAGSPAVSVYKNSLTERAEASAFTGDYDGLVGLNQILLDTSASSSFYAGDNFFDVIFTAGTLGGFSLVGRSAGSFSLTTRMSDINDGSRSMVQGTVTSGATTTSVPTSAFTVAGVNFTAVTDQFKGRSLLFKGDTTTVGLRGAATTIIAVSNSSTPTFTVSALPATPASGDLFVVV
jgi:hypothetical protein